MQILNETAWIKQYRNFQAQDKLELLKCFKLKKLGPGQRIAAHSETIDDYNLILKGRVGIFYPDSKSKGLNPSRITICNEAEADKRRAK